MLFGQKSLLFWKALFPRGGQTDIAGSKVTAILLNGWILPIGGASLGRVCAQPAKQACFHKFISFPVFLYLGSVLYNHVLSF